MAEDSRPPGTGSHDLLTGTTRRKAGRGIDAWSWCAHPDGGTRREREELMECRRPAPILMIVMLAVIPARSALVGQSTAPKGYVHACDLVTNADVEKVTGRHLKDDPGRLGTTKHTESGCDFWDASIQVALIMSR